MADENLHHTRIEKLPSPGRLHGKTSLDLPTELHERASRRLSAAALVYAATYTVALTTGEFVSHVIGESQHDMNPGHLIAAIFVGLSLLVAYLTRTGRISPKRVTDFGLAYEIVGGLGIGLGSFYESWQPGMMLFGISWICIWVISYPLIVPSPPRKTILASLVTAAMGPFSIAFWIWFRGNLNPPLDIWLGTTIPNFICAGIAIYGSSVIYGMGREIAKARQMGSYQLDKMLGRGGMGEVWRAKHRMLARPAAIKLIHPEMLGGREPGDVILQRFEREAQATGALTSPHTIRLFDFGTTDEGVFYYVMELLEGLDLERLVDRYGPIPPGRAIHFLTQTCDSLAEAHAMGLVHRDIKPANIYACRIGLEHDFTKVLDFGLVKPAGREHRDVAKLTAESITTGTPAYMPPEIAMGQEVDHRADLYALGCVGYWLLTRELVFPGESAIDVVLKHVKDEALPPSRRTEMTIPAELDETILWCLAKEPDSRPPDAIALRDRLRELRRSWDWTEELAREWWDRHRPEEALAEPAPAAPGDRGATSPGPRVPERAPL